MERNRKLMTGLVLSLFFLTGCMNAVRREGKIAETFVEGSGYYIRERLGEVETYLLEDRLLDGTEKNLAIERMWSVQEEDSRKYLGKKISVYGFVVKNHLLQQTFRSPQKIMAFVVLSEGSVIGGYSYPDSDEEEAYYTFDGSSWTRILMDRYVFSGESEHWKARYVVDSKRVFSGRKGRIEYDGSGNAQLDVTCKGEPEELGRALRFEIAYASGFGTGSSTMEFDEAQYLDKVHTLKSGGISSHAGPEAGAVRITVRVDDHAEEMELHLVP